MTFTSLDLKGKPRMAMRFVTQRGAGDIILPDNTDPKSVRPVINVLCQTHPVTIVATVVVIDHYNAVPKFTPLNVTKDTVESISGILTGTAGPGRINTNGLQQWLLRFGIASQRLHHEVALLAKWIPNNPPWTAIRALQENRLMALDKFPGVQPINIGEI